MARRVLTGEKTVLPRIDPTKSAVNPAIFLVRFLFGFFQDTNEK